MYELFWESGHRDNDSIEAVSTLSSSKKRRSYVFCVGIGKLISVGTDGRDFGKYRIGIDRLGYNISVRMTVDE